MNNFPYPSWLNDAVFYEVYPQSFQDCNGDGIGDLPGVIRRLDYIRSLGCNAIWLNPCFESPFEDAGYDISDFYKVAPRYGSNADLARLFEEAHARGMKVCLDLVAGHTSTKHPWFQASARAERNEDSDRYVWTDSVWTNVPQGLSQISGYGERDGNYVNNFFHFQPALNYGFAKPDPAQPWQLPVDHPVCRATREEMKNIMRFWLDQGADGFRVDMASSLVKGDPDFTATMALWAEMRELYDREYPEAVLIAEWSDPARAIPGGFHIDFLIHFNFPGYTSLFRAEPDRDLFRIFKDLGGSFFDAAGQGNIRVFLDEYLHHLKLTEGQGFISLPTGNHDIMRLAHGRSPEELRVALAFLFTMPGVPYIYAGDEIGQRYVEGLVSKEGGYNRTGARCPMAWDDTPNAGFSTADPAMLYLPMDPRSDRPTVAEQENDPESPLNLVRRLLALRRENAALGNDAPFQPLYAEANRYPFVYLRGNPDDGVLIAVNPAARTETCTFSLERSHSLRPLLSSPATIEADETHLTLTLPPVSFGIWGLAPEKEKDQ
ncbi:MAG: glycosylase [Verrucomicrobia bacterium]|nr:glycosylase [Verrucomicrobiota bacterium]MCH8510089.1 glycosylase [Kiritimatiellia bacterium]